MPLTWGAEEQRRGVDHDAIVCLGVSPYLLRIRIEPEDVSAVTNETTRIGVWKGDLGLPRHDVSEAACIVR